MTEQSLSEEGDKVHLTLNTIQFDCSNGWL